MSRVIRLCLRYGVSPVFIPEREPQLGGSVENFNSWFQEPSSSGASGGPATCGGSWRGCRRRSIPSTSTRGWGARHRRGLRLQELPTSFVVPTGRLPLAEGRVIFIRRVSLAGTVTLLSQSFRVGKKHHGLYLRLVIDTRRGTLTAYLNGRVVKRWPYELLNG